MLNDRKWKVIHEDLILKISYVVIISYRRFSFTGF